MITLHQRSVNVSRLELLKKLRENLDLHCAEYASAIADYQERLLADLKLAVKKVAKVHDVNDLVNFSFSLPYPKNYEDEFTQVIEMMEMSVDETIELDSNSFRAYVKNEWSWGQNFRLTNAMYKTAGSALSF
jgi:hypothetical protein